MSLPADTTPANTSDHEGDAQRWQEAAELRQEHRAWIVIWLASNTEFRAYRRSSRTRRDTAFRAATASEMKTQIMEAEKPARPPRQVSYG